MDLEADKKHIMLWLYVTYKGISSLVKCTQCTLTSNINHICINRYQPNFSQTPADLFIPMRRIFEVRGTKHFTSNIHLIGINRYQPNFNTKYNCIAKVQPNFSQTPDSTLIVVSMTRI